MTDRRQPQTASQVSGAGDRLGCVGSCSPTSGGIRLGMAVILAVFEILNASAVRSFVVFAPVWRCPDSSRRSSK
jgi:hypothetical protein